MTSDFKRLSEYADVKGGKRLPKGKNLTTTPTKHPYIRVRDLGTDKVLELDTSYEYVDDETQATISRYTVKAGDVVISIVGTIGLVAEIGHSLNGANLTENCAKIVNIQGLNKDFLYYYLLSGEGQNAISAGTVGAVQPKLPLKNIQALPIPNLPISEQDVIADALSALDARIAENRKINHHLEQMAKAKFDDMFPNISIGDSTVGEYITPKRGRTLISKDAISGEVPVIAGGLVPTVYHNVANTQEPVITISASGANAGFVNLWSVPVWSSDSSFIDKAMTNDVYFWYVMLKKRQSEIYESQTGSAQPHIYPSHIAGLPTIALDKDEITAFTEFATPLFDNIALNLAENLHLATIRDTLLPRLMSGELSVADLGDAK